MSESIRRSSGTPNVGLETLFSPRKLVNCRLCGGSDLDMFLSLGNQPLANALLEARELGTPEYTAPLQLCRCITCGHVQLTHTVPPEIMFANYRYKSGVNAAWHRHCEKLADKQSFGNTLLSGRVRRFMVDIASNDGTLLSYFAKQGWHVLGIEPAENLAHSLPVVRDYWSTPFAISLRKGFGPVDLITAQNVFGHVDDPLDFLMGVQVMLVEDGKCIIEVPSLIELLRNTAFDTIYHEHLSYWSLDALRTVAGMAHLVVTDVEQLPVHGGSMRVTLKHNGPGSPAMFQALFEEDKMLRNKRTFKNFPKIVNGVLTELDKILRKFAKEGKIVGAYGASAKGATLLNLLSLIGTPLPVYVLDDNPLKQNMYMPGSHVPIFSPELIGDVDVMMLLSWNWDSELKARCHALGFDGKFLIPLPEPRIER
jgi:C-methyltransferase-like protein/putative zinc binding protein/methyltransferase family protein